MQRCRVEGLRSHVIEFRGSGLRGLECRASYGPRVVFITLFMQGPIDCRTL